MLKSYVLKSVQFSIIFCLILCNSLMYAQYTKGISGETSLDDLIVSQWSVRDGLLTNKVNDVIQSLDGYLWITTYHGILRFDGKNFNLYNKNNVDALQSDAYYKIFQSPDSSLFFLSRSNGIIEYKNGEFKPYEHNDKIPLSLRTTFLDSQNRLWLATFDYLYVIEDGQLTKLDNELINNGVVLGITEDQNGNAYFGTDGNGVIKYDGNNYQQFTEEDGLAENVIISIATDREGKVVAGTFKGISIIDKNIVRSISYTDGARVNDILIDDYFNILLATDLGLYRINELDSTFEKMVEGNKLPTREINSLDIDHENNIWMGMEKGGLIRLKEGRFVNITENDGLSLNRVNIVVERSDGEYWAGSDNGDIDIIDLNKKTITPFIPQKPIDNKGIRDFLFDSQGNIWVASYNGLLKISGTSEYQYTEENGLSSSLVRRVIEDSDGNIWIGTRNGGVNKIKRNGEIEIFDRSSGMLVNYVLDLKEDDQGRIFVATNRGGVSLIDKEGNVKNYDEFTKGLDLVNFNLSSDSKGRLWLTNGNGLYYFDGTQFKRIETKDILATDALFDFIDDGRGSFWLTTNIGLVEIKESQIEEYLNGQAKVVAFNLYDNSDGMISRECTAATRSILASDGKIWIPTIGGITILNPSKVIVNNRIPQVHITDFVVDEVKFDIRKSIKLQPNHVRCKIGFTALSYKAPANVQFKYKLVGLDQDWISSTGSVREIQYTNLPYGEYTFKVIASNNDGIWNEKGAEINFKVEPFIYQTKVFYVISTLFIVIGFISISRWREKKINKRNVELQKLNAELDSFVYSTSHDLRAPLASVLGLINIAKLDKNSENKDNYMQMMETSIKKLDSFIQDIIDYSRNSRTQISYESFDIKSVIEDVIDSLRYLDPKDEIKGIIKVNGDGVAFCDKQRTKIIFNNLISNSLKYHDPTKSNSFLKISIDLEDPLVMKIFVEDNGIGIEQNEMDKIFGMFYRGTEKSKGSGIGLYIVKETVDKMKGTITVDSKLGEGCRFEITIPKR